MLRTLSRLAKRELAPPEYLAPATAGIDVSASGIKLAVLKETVNGLELKTYAQERFAPNITDHTKVWNQAVTTTLRAFAKKYNIKQANIALPGAEGHLFEAIVPGTTKAEWRRAIQRNASEYIPLSAADAVFDVVRLSQRANDAHVIGVAYERRVVDAALKNVTDAGITVNAIESELFALPRAVLPFGSTETVLIIDIGKTTTKLLIVSSCLPRFAKTLNVRGHALTLAVQKHFGVTEEEAKHMKTEHGLVVGDEHKEYRTALLSTLSVIRDEAVHCLDYWKTRVGAMPAYAPVSRVVVVGGNGTLRGLPEYFSAALKVPVERGDVFRNMAPRSEWLPSLEYAESLAYGTAIGLALREYTS